MFKVFAFTQHGKALKDVYRRAYYLESRLRSAT